MKTLVSLLLLASFSAFALEVDEKLTVRVIKTSESKKTIMINRGTEDGLVEGDHAKFIVTAGIVARAVCSRVSPTRSVWSVYRLVNADFILNDSVMSLKITPPVKITKDETQTLVRDDTPTRVSGDPTTLGIPLADGAQDMANAQDDAISRADLKALEENDTPTSIAQKNWEIYGVMAISGLSAQSKTDTDQSFNNSQSFMHIGLGAEIYAKREREWYSRFSLIGGVNIMNESSQAYNGSGVTNQITEFSVGTNWHPFKLPSVANEFIPFIHLGGHFGSVSSSFTPGRGATTTDEITNTGTASGFSVGLGVKFYTYKGFGARALVDYYTRSETYKEEDLSLIKFTKVVAGPRLLLGLSYRF